MLVVPAQKPAVELFPKLYSRNPSKNYMFQLLLATIRTCSPSRSLDAGVGALRNFWMFPGHYIGISHNRGAYFKGLTLPQTKMRIARNGPPEVYLMRLERDFSFLGGVDLCVCTQTIFYTEDPTDVGRRLSAQVRQGGSMILEHVTPALDAHLGTLIDDYESVEVIYWGRRDCAFLDETCPKEKLMELSRVEMNAPNIRDDHAHFFLVARNKLKPAVAIGSRPEIVEDRGLNIVKDDIPFLKM